MEIIGTGLLIWLAVGFLALLIVAQHNEQWVGRISVVATGGHLLLTLTLLGLFLFSPQTQHETTPFHLFKDLDFQLTFSLLIDRVSLTFLLMLSILCCLVSLFARVYLHRESGYRRFFATLLLFEFGYSVLVLADGFELLFAGWEFVGLSSFLLISFYSHRVRPVKNALRVFSIYRLGDLGLLMAAWMAHNLWHLNPSFTQIAAVSGQSSEFQFTGVTTLALLLILAAGVKSAQFPFTYWLPKAMEGPTPSSAIFYGSLSVHLGVFLLLRTQPLWEASWVAKMVLFTMGLSSVVVGAGLAHVQSNIKAQLAYASIAQVGMIFIELVLGWTNLALFHCVSHAFLRAYQILLSSSVASYLIDHQNRSRRETWFVNSLLNRLSPRLRSTVYVFLAREALVEDVLHDLLWRPMKSVGRILGPALSFRGSAPISLLILGGLIWISRHPDWETDAFAVLAALGAISAALSALSERKSALRAWVLIGFSQLFTFAAVFREDTVSLQHMAIFLLGVGGYWILGLVGLRLLAPRSLNGFGMAEHATSFRKAFFLVCCLGVVAFPVGPAFLGLDLILLHANKDNLWLAGLIAFTFVVVGVASLRLYARVCLGQNVPGDFPHPTVSG